MSTMFGDGHLGLPDADGLDEDHVEAGRLEQHDRLPGRPGDPAEGARRRRRPDVGVRVRRPAAPSGSCRPGSNRRCASTTGRRRAPRPGAPARSGTCPSASMNVDLPTPGTPVMPTRMRLPALRAAAPAAAAGPARRWSARVDSTSVIARASAGAVTGAHGVASASTSTLGATVLTSSVGHVSSRS